MKIVALAGGVGGAKLADGFAQVLSPEDLTIIVNTGDDFEHLGLHISPDLDTVCYTLAGLADARTGWGRADETWQALNSLEKLGGPAWFRLGDRDLGTHLERTRRLKSGIPLSQITADFCSAWGVKPKVLPMSDQIVSTFVQTEEGSLPFQEYFVHQSCEPTVKGFEFRGADRAQAAPGILESLEAADAIVICPSNPWVSIGPILAIAEIRRLIHTRPAFAVSPIIGGVALKGPAAKMYTEMGITPSALAVAAHYGDLIRGIVIDRTDSELLEPIARYTMCALATDTIMKSSQDRRRLAEVVIDFVGANLQ